MPKTRRDGHKTRKPFFPELKTTQNLFHLEKNWDFFSEKASWTKPVQKPKKRHDKFAKRFFYKPKTL